MTRVTNFGRKRSYVQAGFATEASSASHEHAASDSQTTVHTSPSGQPEPVPPKKRRKTKPKTGKGGEVPSNSTSVAKETTAEDKGEGPSTLRKVKKKKQERKVKAAAAQGYARRTEQRRLKRTADRQANTTCFACREKGHAARDCPKATEGKEDGDASSKKNTNKVVGMCYRCGSTGHTLSRCKKSEDPHDPLPFASCFVCSGKGHLASSCPQNKEKGIYPDGGCCKLCGENTHLAKDCELRKRDQSGTAAGAVFGTGKEAGADEDDFHTFKRRNAEVTKDEKKGLQRKKADLLAASTASTVKALGRPAPAPRVAKAKKVVYF
ncbi:hypothetical protein F5I97DRAFT_1803135 [Phlebopus sp. FC_14]|nr:hypothetical protein F5I97DRAFT_1803135 [Phlebopus sp. FC_14]